jgi:squalene synthase HpnC
MSTAASLEGWAAGDASVESWSGKDRADENFPVGSMLIARALRPHVHAFYAFARNADDIADSPLLAPADKVARLDVMQAVLLGETDAGSPSALGLRGSLAATGVTTRHATDLLVAFRRDAVKTRYADWDELYDYCRYSAMPVGRHVLDLHGENAGATYPASDALCAALQVLNHLQDCAKDLAALDRCYLPLDLLRTTGAAVEDLRLPHETPPLRRATGDRRLRLETAVIVGLARRLATRLRYNDPLATRVKLSKTDMAGSLLAALRFLP